MSIHALPLTIYPEFSYPDSSIWRTTINQPSNPSSAPMLRPTANYSPLKSRDFSRHSVCLWLLTNPLSVRLLSDSRPMFVSGPLFWGVCCYICIARWVGGEDEGWTQDRSRGGDRTEGRRPNRSRGSHVCFAVVAMVDWGFTPALTGSGGPSVSWRGN